MALTINDPGNADLAITVGSTHRDMPHVYGVSYFSSKGPTGDGRLKPDLVAPGEKIISCAAGTLKQEGAKGRAVRLRRDERHEHGRAARQRRHRRRSCRCAASSSARPERVKEIFVVDRHRPAARPVLSGRRPRRPDARHSIGVSHDAGTRGGHVMHDIAGIPYRRGAVRQEGRASSSRSTLPGRRHRSLRHLARLEQQRRRRARRSTGGSSRTSSPWRGRRSGRPHARHRRRDLAVEEVRRARRRRRACPAARRAAPASARRDAASLEGARGQARSDEGVLHRRPASSRSLDEARALLPDLEDKATARRAFVDKIRSLLDPSAANNEDASDSFFKDDGNELMKNLKVDDDDLDEEVCRRRGRRVAAAGRRGAAPASWRARRGSSSSSRASKPRR